MSAAPFSFGAAVGARISQAVRETQHYRRAARRAATLPFYDWVKGGNFYIDREPCDFELWRVLGLVYEMFPRTPEGWRRFDFSGMKPAQNGFTVLALFGGTYLASGGHGNVGYYLPTADLAWEISDTRFVPLIRSNPELHRLLGSHEDTGKQQRADEGSKGLRRFGDHHIFFTYLGGVVSTESRPLDALFYDEVQEMRLADMQKADERLGASELRVKVRVSTANIEGADIAHHYEESDQRAFHNECGCEDGVVLADCWHPDTGPSCIDVLKPTNLNPSLPRNQAFYVCPTCSTVLGTGGAWRNKETNRIEGDLRVYQGDFRIHAPEHAPRIGVTYPQMLSPRQTAQDILDAWRTRADTGHFYRRKLAKPYTDPDAVPITPEICQEAQRDRLRWIAPEQWNWKVDRRPFAGIFLGVDHMKNNNYVVVKGLLRDTGLLRYIWCEIVRDKDPFRRTAEIMRRFRVDIAALEEGPNLNEAWQFAEAFPGRAFIARYNELPSEPVSWGDRPRDRAGEKRTADEARVKFTVSIDQHRMMSWSLGRWTRRKVETPPAILLQQKLMTDRGLQDVCVGHELWTHLQRVGLVVEPIEGKENEERWRRKVVKIRIDPHFAFANMLADVAVIRRFGTDIMLFDGEDEMGEPTKPATATRAADIDQVKKVMPEMFASTNTELLALEDGRRGGRDEPSTCGVCQSYEKLVVGPGQKPRGTCTARNFTVTADAPACLQFEAVPEEETYE